MNNCPSASQEANVECVTCKRCQSTCPTKVDLPEVVRLQRYLNRPRGSHRDLFLLTQKVQARSEVTPWLSTELDTGRDDIYYFPGCQPILDELIEGATDFKRAPNAGVALLNHLGISPKIIYGCCGHDLYYSGNLEHFELIRRRLSSIKGKVITGCAECYHSLKSLHGVDAVHIAEILDRELKDEGSSMRERTKVTFHDPCRLGRHHGIYDAPRNVLSKVSDLKEMDNAKEDSICCGVSAWMNCNPVSKLARLKRLRQAADVDAEVLVTACSKCQTHLGCVYREESYEGDPKELQVLDLQEFVADALGVKVPESVPKAVKGRRLSPIQEVITLDDALSAEGIENAFACTTCERCEVECEYAYEAVHDVESLRRDVVASGRGPEEHHDIAKKVKSSGNVFGESAGYARSREGAEYVYFPGCVAQFRKRSLLEDTLKVLDALGIEYEVPADLVCCGSVLKRTGHDLTGVMEKNKRLLAGRKVITSCAGCFSTLKRDYEGLDVIHVSQLLAERSGDLNLGALEMELVYHDPCHLGRRMSVYDEPRKVLSSIPGLKVREFSTSKERATCCGGGGGVRSARKDLSSKLGSEKAKEAEGMGVDAIVTACPFCEVNLEGSGVEVLDIVEIVARSLKEGKA
jgi:fumarate reductase (CoM/CoB) subunit B